MYSSLLKIDIVASKPDGPMYVQTDHRERAEIAAEPEISILFALTRVLNARAHAVQNGHPKADVVYACMDEPTPELIEALAAAGAVLETRGGQGRRSLEPIAATPAEVADRAFRDLVKRVQGRVGLTDRGATLRALEAETLADPLDVEDDELAYWTRVLELAAVTCEVLRERDGGRWVECDRADVPFGFQTTGGEGIVLATNRAARFIADGEGESMFTLLAAQHEMGEHEDGTILPSLRSRTEVTREKMLWRPLLERNPDPELPVIAYGTDSPSTFGLLMDERTDDRDELHARALANLAKQEVEVGPLELGGVDILAVSGSFFATEKLLDREFMLTLHRRLGPMLAASVPRRGVMFVTNAAPKDPVQAMRVLGILTEKECSTSRAISSAILLIQDGNVVGQVQLTSDPPAAAEPPAKKPGFFRRLFGAS